MTDNYSPARLIQILEAIVRLKQAESNYQSLLSDTDEAQRAELEPGLRDSHERVEAARFQLQLLLRHQYVERYTQIQEEARKRLNEALERQFQVHNTSGSTHLEQQEVEKEVAEAFEHLLEASRTPVYIDENSDQIWRLVK